MATENLDIVVSVVDQASDEVNKIGDNLEKVTATARQVGIAFTAAGAAITAVAAVSIQAFQEQERAETKLEQITRQTTGATDDQIQALKEQAVALQDIGIIGDEVTLVGQAQLATFGLQTDAIGQLSGGMLDLAANQYGVNASQSDLMNVANLMGKVMEGQVGALTRVGVSFTDAQEEILKTGTEMERATTLSEVLSQNFGGLNEALAETSEGRLAQLKNDFGDLQEQIGAAVVPILERLIEIIGPIVDKIGDWIDKNPELASKIVMVVVALGGLMLVLGPILIALPTIIAAVGVLGTVFGVLLGPVGLVIAIVVALIAVGVLLWRNWDTIKEKAEEVWTAIVDRITQFFDDVRFIFEALTAFFTEWWNEEITKWQIVIDFLTSIWTTLWEGISSLVTIQFTAIKTVIEAGFNFTRSLFDGFISVVESLWETFWSGLSAVVVGIWDAMKETVKSGLNFIIDAINAFIRAANEISQKANIIPGVSIPMIPEIPLLARGGNITGAGAAIVGEQGPELLNLPQGARVSPLNAAGPNIVININNPQILSDEDLVEKVGDPILNVLKMHFSTV